MEELSLLICIHVGAADGYQGQCKWVKSHSVLSMYRVCNVLHLCGAKVQKPTATNSIRGPQNEPYLGLSCISCIQKRIIIVPAMVRGLKSAKKKKKDLQTPRSIGFYINPHNVSSIPPVAWKRTGTKAESRNQIAEQVRKRTAKKRRTVTSAQKGRGHCICIV